MLFKRFKVILLKFKNSIFTTLLHATSNSNSSAYVCDYELLYCKYNNYGIQIRYSTWCNLLYSKFNLNILMELNGLHDKSKNAEREKVHKLTGNVLKSFDVFLLCFVLSCFVLFTCLQAKPTFLLLGNVNQFVGVKT